MKSLLFGLAFVLASSSAMASVTTVAQTVTRVSNVTKPISRVNNSVLGSLSQTQILVAQGKPEVVEVVNSIASSIERISKSDRDVNGLSKADRIQALVNAFASVVNSPDANVIKVANGNVMSMASTPVAATDQLNPEAFKKLSDILEKVANGEDLDVAVQTVTGNKSATFAALAAACGQ